MSIVMLNKFLKIKWNLHLLGLSKAHHLNVFDIFLFTTRKQQSEPVLKCTINTSWYILINHIHFGKNPTM